MAKDYIGYEALTENALRMVVREALRHCERQGLLAGHHFYITFKTGAPGVDMPDFLRERYPEEITIVLQNQFWGLKVGDDSFDVTLTFQKLPAELHVPYAAVTGFFDPAVQFGLQFGRKPGEQKIGPADTQALAPAPAAPAEKQPTVEAPAPAVPGEAQIVSLDKFRKK